MINWGSLPDSSIVGVTTSGSVWRWSSDGVRRDTALATDAGPSLRTSADTWLAPFTTVDGDVKVIDGQTGEEVFTAPGLGGEVFPAISPGDEFLVLLDLDGQAVLYDLG